MGDDTGEATPGEAMLTEDIFCGLGKIGEYELDFADSGNEILVTDTADGARYTITVRQETNGKGNGGDK